MKIEPQKTTFNPIVLTLETPEEVAAIFSLVNHPTLTDIVGAPSAWAGRISSCNLHAGNPPICADELFHDLCQALKP